MNDLLSNPKLAKGAQQYVLGFFFDLEMSGTFHVSKAAMRLSNHTPIAFLCATLGSSNCTPSRCQKTKVRTLGSVSGRAGALLQLAARFLYTSPSADDSPYNQKGPLKLEKQNIFQAARDGTCSVLGNASSRAQMPTGG